MFVASLKQKFSALKSLCEIIDTFSLIGCFFLGRSGFLHLKLLEAHDGAREG